MHILYNKNVHFRILIICNGRKWITLSATEAITLRGMIILYTSETLCQSINRVQWFVLYVQRLLRSSPYRRTHSSSFFVLQPLILLFHAYDPWCDIVQGFDIVVPWVFWTHKFDTEFKNAKCCLWMARWISSEIFRSDQMSKTNIKQTKQINDKVQQERRLELVRGHIT